MDLFLNALKGQINTLNLVILLFVLSLGAALFKRTKLARIGLAVSVLFFFLVSTEYLPYYLASRMESAYISFERSSVMKDSQQVFIQVLGGGYTFDERLPPAGQLSPISLGRLIEGIRIFNELPGSKLVFSGWRVSGTESMAAVMKQSAMSLGVDSTRIDLLEEPRTTEDEASNFVRRFGSDAKLILVTDALHMHRALGFFRQDGINPHPAPTNYLAREDGSRYRLRWMPSSKNLLLMDRILREWLGTLKGKI